MTVILLFCLAACVYSNPISSEVRLPRAPAYGAASSSANSGAFAGAGGGAIASAGTAVFPGPGGSGSFNAKAGVVDLNEFYKTNAGTGSATYAPAYSYDKNKTPDQNGLTDITKKSSIPLDSEENGFNLRNMLSPMGTFGGSAAFAGTGGSFAGTGGFTNNFNKGYSPNFNMPPPFPVPADLLRNMQDHFDFVRKQVENHRNIAESNNNFNGAAAFGQIGPQGGFGKANIFPKPAGGIDVRFGEDDAVATGPVSSVQGNFAPPSGSFHEISSFSSSVHTDNNGEKSFNKIASVSINDNGKVTTYTAHNP